MINTNGIIQTEYLFQNINIHTNNQRVDRMSLGEDRERKFKKRYMERVWVGQVEGMI